VKNHIEKIQAVFQGECWHGPNITEVLANISSVQASYKPTPNTNSIAELIEHIVAWRRFTVEMLGGNVEFKIDVEAGEDWPRYPNGVSEAQWTAIKKSLDSNQEELVATMTAFDNSKADQNVGHRPFTFQQLAGFIIDHDLWHCGQIALLKKLSIAN